MSKILEMIEEAIKNLLIGWIDSNLANMFSDVNASWFCSQSDFAIVND